MTDRGMGSEWGQKLGGAGAEPLEWCSPSGGAEPHTHQPLHRDCRHRWPCATRAAGSGWKGLQSQILTPKLPAGVQPEPVPCIQLSLSNHRARC